MQQRGDYQAIANRIRTDMDGRGPRLRLSVVGLLTEAGIIPTEDFSAKQWLELVSDTVDYVAADVNAYADHIAELEIPEDTDHPEEDVKNAYEVRGGSQYL